MLAHECSAVKELPETFNLVIADDRTNLAKLGELIAVREGLHFEGYVAYTDTPYSVENAKITLCFN
jgi:hypothetical protein